MFFLSRVLFRKAIAFSASLESRMMAPSDEPEELQALDAEPGPEPEPELGHAGGAEGGDFGEPPAAVLGTEVTLAARTTGVDDDSGDDFGDFGDFAAAPPASGEPEPEPEPGPELAGPQLAEPEPAPASASTYYELKPAAAARPKVSRGSRRRSHTALPSRCSGAGVSATESHPPALRV